MFSDDNRVFIYDNNYDDFTQVFNSVLSHMSKWLQVIKLVLNVNLKKHTHTHTHTHKYFKILSH